MNVKQLNDNEMYELKDKLYTDFYYDKNSLPNLTREQRRVIEAAVYPPDIPDWVVYNVYGGISFVKDDFFCNA